MIYCPENLGCYWELVRVDREDRFNATVQAKMEAKRLIGLNVLGLCHQPRGEIQAGCSQYR